MAAERFLIRTEGGPHPGTRTAAWSWPLPNTLPDDGGVYVKVTESDLPPQSADSRIRRGATYEWQAADG